MVKLKIGQRTAIIIDELDIMIFTEIGDNPMGVMELTKNLNVQHKTIKNHLDKLKLFHLIKIEELPQNKKRISITEPVRAFIIKYRSLLDKIRKESKP